MMHVRAHPADLDDWAYNGSPGWSFDDCLPYYQKSENQVDDTNPTAGKGGPIQVVNARDTGNPVSQTFLDACVELGYPLVEDFNASLFGAGWQHVDLKNGKRGGALTSYLLPALARGNVTLRTGALATKLLFEKDRCIGVEYVVDGQESTRTCRAPGDRVLRRHRVAQAADAVGNRRRRAIEATGHPRPD